MRPAMHLSLPLSLSLSLSQDKLWLIPTNQDVASLVHVFVLCYSYPKMLGSFCVRTAYKWETLPDTKQISSPPTCPDPA
ncbi:uncharacterized protein RAG0_08351 [Rhynchosporium agropyri]|uniref:Uncharacterized protein n=1 Tax=Rhynchosporium agropyri TaxID=914238 RepID=A0A1E1KQF7_9HELO|nr:uncharacterized protein RAG0_08351 [Rhynchosporium agropyri]